MWATFAGRAVVQRLATVAVAVAVASLPLRVDAIVGGSESIHARASHTPTCTHAFIHAWQQQNTVGTKVFCFIALACDRSTSDSISALMPWPDVNLDLLAPPPHHPRCDAWPTAVRPPSGQDCDPSGGTFIISTDEDVDNVRADCISINGSLDVG